MSIDPPIEAASLARQLEELNRIGAALSAERNTRNLLELILTKAREITDSDAGSLYVVEEDDAVFEAGAAETEPVRRLRFVIAQNDSVAVPFREIVLDITDRSIAGFVALTGEPVNLADAYRLPEGVPFTFNRKFDESVGYRTRSMLTLPLRTPQGNTIGVLQLLNARKVRGVSIRSEEAADAAVVAYSVQQQAFASTLASQAAVALENSQLYESIKELFEGFVKASVVAIEARDPATSGHSFRVANLTIALAEAADRAGDGPFAGVHFTREELRTIRYASLLHDFGKVGVREEVLVKAKKLYPAQLDLVRERFKLARRSRQVASLQARLDYLLANGHDRYVEQLPAFEAALLDETAALHRHLAAIEAANEPALLDAGGFERLQEIAAVLFDDVEGTARPLISGEEVRLLSLRKGSLSEAERVEIESHVVHTYHFLSQIPWTKEIRRIPAIAGRHHERLNGKGYPSKLAAADIPIQTRMMTISDIFDALSAADRPYKKAVPIERALDILGYAVKDGEIDGQLVSLFVDAKVFERWQVEPYPY